MNTSTNCPQARQRCPSPWACGEGCNFNNEAPKQSAQERAAVKFWEPDLPVQFVGPEPEEAVQPDAADMAIAFVQKFAIHLFVALTAISATVFCLGVFL